ncbi:hypothetical protein KP509_18G060700 [Ceratopteris richardii]|uniref:Uncharacterized protein n=1 Tax=Ceratopteris richardii TaxID=49495 RepID=A0A8T2SRL0_CERRI|nr:hypothetical protein KP509_18G060700 [Ceratopteris richardii]
MIGRLAEQLIRDPTSSETSHILEHSKPQVKCIRNKP